MAPLLAKEDRKEISRLFSEGLADEVKVVLFTKRRSDASVGNKKLLEEVASLEAKIRLEVVDIEAKPARAMVMGVELAPTTVILSASGAMVHFVGIPQGRQFRPMIEDIVDASRGKTTLEKGAEKAIAEVNKATSIKVFVTPTCQFSPMVVRSAHKFALTNRLVSAFMVESLEFPDFVTAYGVVGVPRTIVNEEFAFDGWPGETAFAEKVLEISRRA